MASRAATPLSPTTAKKIALDTNENVFHYLLLNWAANALRNKRLDAMKIISNLAQTSQGMNEQKEQTLKKMSNRAAWDYQSPVQVIDRSKAMFHGSLEILLPLYRNLNLDFYNLVCSTGLDSLLFAMGDTVPAVRSKALKILSQAMDIDNDLIKIAVIREAVVTRVADRAISVREEAVKIIGKYVLTKRDDIPVSFLYSLVERLADEGISVRKSSVNCLRELLLSQPNHPLYKELCLKLLERCSMPEEEDTIKEIISSTFQQLWFLPPSETAVFITAPSRTLATYSTPDKDDTDNHRRVISDDKPFSETKDHVEKSISKDSLVKVTAGVTRSRNDKGKALKAIDVHHRATALQLVEFCCLPKAQEWLIMLLRELLHGKGDGDEVKSHVKSRRQNSLDHCANTVKVLVDILLELEEHDHITVDHFTKIGKDYKQAGVDCILTISSICSAQPSLIGHHLPTLLPYLKGDSSYSVEQNNAIKLTIMNILSSSTAQVDSPLKTVDIEEVEQDLFEIAYKGSRSVNIDLAIRCMAEIAAFITNDASRLYSLFTLSFEEIKGVDSQCNKFQDMQATHVNRVMRYIVIAGLVCKHSRICSGLLMSLPENCLDSCDSEDIGNLNERVAMLSLQNIKLSPATISGAGYSLVMFAMAAQISTREMQKAVNNRAVQALCGVFVGCPRLISRPCHSSGLLDELLGPNCETQTQQTFVSALGDLVMIEEVMFLTALSFPTVIDVIKFTGTLRKRAPKRADASIWSRGYFQSECCAWNGANGGRFIFSELCSSTTARQYTTLIILSATINAIVCNFFGAVTLQSCSVSSTVSSAIFLSYAGRQHYPDS